MQPAQLQPNIYIDLDGVCADFANYALAVLGQPYDSLPPGEAWGQLDKIPGLFTLLRPLPGMERLFTALAHHNPRVQILTATPLPTGHLITAAADKTDWVCEHIGPDVPVRTIVGGVNKHAFAAPGDILVDDLERNLVGWRAVGGVGILHVSVDATLAQLAALGLLERG